ncbi:MAG: small acid-soluble spore protein SspI [Paenibacillus sp.]|uniref:Small, acid-soluble spore protein I n=1 Tax=Paenibacillus aquistagni TaxID=1852522 RepID=A0A1X7LUD2_9BACL|nr:small acid-soluble spore protein SspI [Paenibacillus aquistagni]MBR2569551.1 small acid-soluble spore protein SspI [Paenibacillus sp.]NMM51843.1 small acid-soluble spore protein SspI [Paenibacillus aquistagni]SMG57114.1 small acid-soluble spore protein I (minor) [Paenibacillus aquistagni]
MSVLLNLRQAIAQKLTNKSDEDVKEMIVNSVDGDEMALPGLGVLFEMIWKQSDDAAKQQFIDTIQQQLKTT